MSLENWRVPKESVGQNSTLAGLVKRIQYLAQPENVNKFMKNFTERIDMELVKRLKTLDKSEHPKDTGLLQESWQVPKTYLDTHFGKDWKVYAENTATTGEWKIRKSKNSRGSYNRKKGRGNPNFRGNRRYLRFVETKTGFYSKQLRVVKQRIPMLFDIYVRKWLRLMWEGGYITNQEFQSASEGK